MPSDADDRGTGPEEPTPTENTSSPEDPGASDPLPEPSATAQPHRKRRMTIWTVYWLTRT